jgi:hypothetical protein
VAKIAGDLLLQCRERIELGEGSESEEEVLSNLFLRGFQHEGASAIARSVQIAEMTAEEKRFYPPGMPTRRRSTRRVPGIPST